MSAKYFMAVVLACAGIAGCQRVAEPTIGTYRAVLELPGGEAPFGLDVTQENGAYVLYLSNGTERTRVPNVTVQDGELRTNFPGYENRMQAKLTRDALKGTVTLIKAGGEEQVIPLRAKLGETYRFHTKQSTDNADVEGRWDVTFTDDSGKQSKGVLLLDQDHDRVTGTVMTPTGDHRFLDGQIRDDEIWLSTFAGGLAYLYKLKVASGGELRGEYWQGLKWHEKVAAVRNENAQLEDAESLTKLRDGEGTFNFKFRDLDGKEVSLSDERFKGKVVLVTLGGSWCPNCHDEAMFLAPYYRENRERGVEIIALMFERHGEFDKAAAATRRFREDLGVEYTTLIAGISDKEDASNRLPTLSGVYGFPTMLFIDKHGKVRKIHTGFTGPATGKHYEEFVREFHEFVDQLIAET